MNNQQERPLTPSGCRMCGLPEYGHGTYATGMGRHTYQQPTQRQIFARMRSRHATGGKVMCCEDCPPQVTCGSVMCTVRWMLWNQPWNTRNRTDALHTLFCVVGNGYDWINGQLIDATPRPWDDRQGLKGVQIDPDDPLMPDYQMFDPDRYAELKTLWQAEQNELHEVRANVERLTRTPGPLTRGEPAEESDTHSALATMPPDALPDWQAAAEEIRAVVEPVWAQRRADRAAVEAAAPVADVLRAAATVFEQRAAQATPGPWWRPLDVHTPSVVVAALPDGEPGRWVNGHDPNTGRRENCPVLEAATTAGWFNRPRSVRDLEWAALTNPLIGPLIAAALRREANRIAPMYKWVQVEEVHSEMWKLAQVAAQAHHRPPSQ